MSRPVRLLLPGLLLCVVAGCGQGDGRGDKADAADTVAAPAAKSDASPMRSVDLAGSRVAYLEAGKGDRTVVLVHGWASDHRVWSRQIDDLAESRRVLAVDLPGHGSSGEPKRDYSMDLFADGIAAVMEDAGVERACVVGHSNGVPAARQFYRKFPDRTACLVLVDGALQKMYEDSMVEGFLTQFRGEEFRTTVRDVINGMPGYGLTPDDRTDIREMALSQPQHAVVGGMQAAFDDAIWEEDSIDVPVLVVLAAQPAWTDEYEQFVRNLVPQVDYRMLTDVSHFLMVERPGEFNAMLTGYLDEQGG